LLPWSAQVLEHAAKLASATGNKLVVSHVISNSHLRDWEFTMSEVVPAGDLRGDAQSRLEEIVKDHAAFLLVLGAHDISREEMGSVAAHCARAIPDVLILSIAK
jgi:hypothetical protein